MKRLIAAATLFFTTTAGAQSLSFMAYSAVGRPTGGPSMQSAAPSALRAGSAVAATLPPADSRGALGLEILGGAVGSAAGIGLGALMTDCGVDDLGCGILGVLGSGALGVIGSAAGASIVARETGSRRSMLGGVAGGVVGTGVGLGVHWLLNRNSDRNLGDAVTVPIFVAAQGVFAALGSRLVGAARGMQ